MAAILADDIFICIFLNENDRIHIQISMKYVPKSPLDNNPALVEIMVGTEKATSHYLKQGWPDSLTPICGTWGRWVKELFAVLTLFVSNFIKKHTWWETYFRQDLFPSYLCFRRQFHAIAIFRFKSISDLDSGSLPRFFGEFIYAKLKIVVS